MRVAITSLAAIAVVLGTALISLDSNNEDAPLAYGEQELSRVADSLEGIPLLPAELGSVKVRGRDRDLVRTVRQGGFYRIRVDTDSEEPWNAQVVLADIKGVRESDVLRLEVRLRAVEASHGAVTVGFIAEAVARGTEKSLSLERPVSTDWEIVSLPFRVRTTGPGGRLRLALNLGHGLQSIDISGVQLFRYAPELRPEDLPSHNEPRSILSDTTWRVEALERIRQLRMANLTVNVVDSDGNPVPGASVRIEMKRHAFKFGTAVNANAYLGLSISRDDQNRYVQAVDSLFNAAVMEGTMKWKNWDVPSRRKKADGAVDRLTQSGISIRGHALVWPSWGRSPSELGRLASNPGQLQAAILEHVAEQVGSYEGRVLEWDVVNEPYTNDDLINIVGIRGVAEWFTTAHESDPRTGLFVNDFDLVETGNSVWTKHTEYVLQFVRQLKSYGAPLSGIGLQSHFDLVSLSSPRTVLAIMDSLAGEGVQLVVTEFDINIEDEELAAQYTRDFVTAVFSHPASSGFYLWGFWDGRHWKKNALLYREDWSLKPAGREWCDLVFGKWWTKEEGVTDSSGRLRLEGFLGDYSIQVRTDSLVSAAEATIMPGGTSVQIEIN